MAKKPTKTDEAPKPSQDWSIWQQRMAKADRIWGMFAKSGSEVVDRYKLEKSRHNQTNARENTFWRDKFNVLYSSTETMRPSLYAQTPKPEVNARVRDTNDENTTMAASMLESCLAYAIEDLELDEVMENVVGDYLLPGMGLAWLRYGADFVKDEGEEYLDGERFELDYVHYKDIRMSGGRTWSDIWWIAKRVYLFEEEAKERFGPDKAKMLSYSHQQDEESTSNTRNTRESNADQAIIWEIWDKRKRQVVWWSNDCNEILDQKADPLNLKKFFPCPKPLRAVYTTDSFMPQSFYSQYRQQAEELDDITMRIRMLRKALRVVGVYDQSQEALSRLLTGTDNKMVAVQNWAQFASTGGMTGSVQYLPIQEVATVLMELYKQREIAKNEIYEITGFSDIVRGITKASETLGAQEIKNQWAGGRLRMLQKEVQRFCRDIIAIMGEIIAEHFTDESIALYTGFTPPPIAPEEQQQVEQAAQAALEGQQVPPVVTGRQQAVTKFKEVVQLLREEKVRCAVIGIETDSTIQPDEAAERKDRMDFLGAMGAFLQQAAPMAMQYPEMRGLLGGMMMFTVRTFRASRPIEKVFEQFTKELQAQPPRKPEGEGEGEGGDNGQAKLAGDQIKAQTTLQVAQIKQQSDQAKVQAEQQVTEAELNAKYGFEKYKLDREYTLKERELLLREREVRVKEAELGLKQDDQAHDQELERDAASREDERLDLDERTASQAEQNPDETD